MKSVEERLRDAKNDIALIIAALSVDTDHLWIDEQELYNAAQSAAIRVHEELHWLKQVGAAILNTPAPTDDERKAVAR